MDKRTKAPKNDDKICRELAFKRKQCGLSQKQAAERVGIKQSMLSMIETNRRGVKRETADRLMGLYDGILNSRREKLFAGRTDAEYDGDISIRTARLLKRLGEAPGSEVLANAVDRYIALCSYALLRKLYLLNPHNTDRLFSTPKERFDDCAPRLFDELDRIVSYASCSRGIKTSELELDPAFSQEFTDVVLYCEGLFDQK